MLNFSHPYLIISLISLFFSLVSFIILMFETNKSKLSKILSLIFIGSSFWMLFSFLAPQTVFSKYINIIFWRLDFFAAALVGVFLLFFILNLMEKKITNFTMSVAIGLFSGLSYFILFSPFIVSGIILSDQKFVDYQKGSFFIVYALVLATILILSYILVIKNYFKQTKNIKLHHQLKSVFLAMTIPVFLSIFTNLFFPVLNIDFPRLANASIIPFIYFMFNSIKRDSLLNVIFKQFNIHTKILFGFLISAILPIVVIGFFGINYSVGYLTKNIILSNSEDITIQKKKFDVEFDFLRSDLLFLSKTPPVSEIVLALEKNDFNPTNDSSYDEWVALLQKIFVQKIENSGYLMQARFIDKNGNERVRVDNNNGRGIIISEENLQNKANRYYFTDSIGLQKNQVYISRLDLNKEGSPPQVEVPYKPTIRLATPIFNQNEEVSGVLIINVLADNLLNGFIEENYDANKLKQKFLVNDAGYYLINPDQDKQWGGADDLNTGYNFFDDFPDLKDQFMAKETGNLTNGHNFYSFSTYDVSSFNNEGNRWFILSKIAKDDIFAPIIEFEKIASYIIIIFIVLLFLWSWFFSKLISKPIMNLTTAAEVIARGDLNHQILIESKGEIGSLSKSFNKMILAIKQSRAEVDRKVAEQTKEIIEKSKTLDNQQKSILNVLEDVESGKKMIEKQAQELEKFKLAVSQAPTHIVITDANGIILYANPAVKKITGFSLKEILGKKAGSKELWGGLMDDDFYANLWKTIKLDKKVFSGSINNKRKNGQLYIAETSISPLKNSSGEIDFFVGIERDITHEVEVDRMKTEFISLASHQLRTPLSAMKWFLEMLLVGDAGKLNKEQTEMVENIDQSNERMIALVNGLLNISRIESGRIIVEPKPTNIATLIDNLLRELEPKIKERALSVVISQHKNMGEILVDPNLTTEVYRNLLTNAIKYTPNKGEIMIIISKDSKNVISQISDNGLGIPLKDQNKIFEKFHRASNVLKTETDGTGLGLYLAKAIIESSSGKIWFESKEGEGTTFWFTLPLTGMTAKKGDVRLGENQKKELVVETSDSQHNIDSQPKQKLAMKKKTQDDTNKELLSLKKLKKE